MKVRIGDHDRGLHLLEESIVLLVIGDEPASDTALENQYKTVDIDLRDIKHFRKFKPVKHEHLKERHKKPEYDASDQTQNDRSSFLFRGFKKQIEADDQHQEHHAEYHEETESPLVVSPFHGKIGKISDRAIDQQMQIVRDYK